MEKKKRGKPVSTKGIDARQLKDWMGQDISRWAGVKCQAMISLANGTGVSEVCKVLGVTRESVRLWRKVLAREGPDGFVSHKRTGRKPKLGQAAREGLRKALSMHPSMLGHQGDKWKGEMACKYLEDKWSVKISVRAAQKWIRKLSKA